MSPFLFIIMAEAFGRAIQKAQGVGLIKGITITGNIPNITHQQFANDTILPGSSTKE